MAQQEIIEGIIIGAIGGAAAGLTVSFVGYLHQKANECCDKCRVYSWLRNNTKDVEGERHRTTRTIASHNNLTEDRVRYICSIHNDIYLSTGAEPDVWGVYGIGRLH